MCSGSSPGMKAAEGAWRFGTAMYSLCINPMLSQSPWFQVLLGLVPSTFITFALVKRFIQSFIENLFWTNHDAVLLGNSELLVSRCSELMEKRRVNIGGIP